MQPDMKSNEQQEDGDNAILELSKALPDFNIIPVTLTFDGYAPFKFRFKRQQSKDIVNAKQAYYDLNEAEQKEKLVPYRIQILSSLLVSRPKNMPNWPLTEDHNYKAEFNVFFGNEDNNELLSWIWSQYQEKLYPKELLSSPSD